MNTALTNGIEVSVKTKYLPDQSSPNERQYFFTYEVSITNKTSQKAQLLERHWYITNGYGHTEEVQGPGVVGLQPVIGPGQTFVYNSFCPLATPTGEMHGTYKMVDQNGEVFEAKIPMFLLSEPSLLN